METLSYGFWLLALVTVAYIATGVDLALHDKWDFAVVYGAYGIANIGLMYAIYK